MPRRLMIVEQHELLAETVAIALEHHGFSVERPADLTPEGVLACAREHNPQVVLLGLRLSRDQSSIPLIGPLRQLSADVLVLSGGSGLRSLAECVEAGAVGVVDTSVTLDELIRVLRRVARTGTALRQHERDSLLQYLREARGDDEVRAAPFQSLSAREREVLHALTRGMTAASIAERDCVSLSTVRTQIRSVLAKLGVQSQLAAVALAATSNWFPESPDAS